MQSVKTWVQHNSGSAREEVEELVVRCSKESASQRRRCFDLRVSAAAQNPNHGVDGVIDRTVVDQGLHIVPLDRDGAPDPFLLLVC